MTQRIVVDPVTRIEGHLRVECDVGDGKVSKAWASGTMWRGIELILQGKDPRDAWVFAQRICGVCTTVHAITSVRAVENALKMEIPLNAQYIRNLIQGAHNVHDHIVHFYHLSALDFVDITSALKADPAATATLAQSLSDWSLNTTGEFATAQKKLQAFINSGQLGIFGSGYWGHPAMKLSHEANLMAATHYLQALDVQRKMNKVVAILGSKTPHIQNMAVGGVTNPINLDSQSTLTLEKLTYIKTLIDEVGDFITKVYIPDVAAIGTFYADWTKIGRGIVNYLSIPDMPLDTKGTKFALPAGFIENGDIAKGFTPIKDFHDPYFEKGVKESVKHSWYQGGKGALHPYDGETIPNYTDWQDDGKYSFIKSPTFYDKRAQVGPLANVLGLYASGHQRTQFWVNAVLDSVSSLVGSKIGVDALHSTIGRHAARAVRCVVLHEELSNQWKLLMENIGRGDTMTFNKPVFPKEEVRGFGFHEAPRGMLSHWVVIDKGKIKNYQAVVPTTWNAGPRDEDDRISAYEAALIDTPVAVADQPLEIIRTLHSFDPCLACAVHLTDTENSSTYQVKVV
ncbi:nickel-dependent hydrogenase large subunit [Azospirillum sp.]|uniref:nickel-dependent hydrogenase large subunit n=1 Tax=Azospirillum sp. TaxID=34012 RepID=UPI00260C94CB|nr:nickel-dependent hydrogenase large subunit [Azospirillum sp.]